MWLLYIEAYSIEVRNVVYKSLTVWLPVLHRGTNAPRFAQDFPCLHIENPMAQEPLSLWQTRTVCHPKA